MIDFDHTFFGQDIKQSDSKASDSIYGSEDKKRIYVTDDKGAIFLDIDDTRVKTYFNVKIPSGEVKRGDLKYPDLDKKDGTALKTSDEIKDLIKKVNK